LLYVFRNTTYFGDSSHEIRIASPPGYDMKVQMFLVACPGFSAEIHANIESIRAHYLLQRARGPFDPIHEVTILAGG
jgi:hypothetical protein